MNDDPILKAYLKHKGENPDNYKQCDVCNGYGSSLNEDSHVCSKCGGSGLLKSILPKENRHPMWDNIERIY